MKAKRKPLPPIVRIDEDEPGELYVLVVDDCGDYVPDSLHTDKPGAERRARWLAKMMGCKWYKNYIKTAAIGLALVVLAGAAGAQESTGHHYATIPPVAFDHFYKDDLAINVVRSDADMQAVCRKPGVVGLMGCSVLLGKLCVIHLRDEATLRKANRTHELVVRHEMGHCNGWPADHSGARRPKLGEAAR